MQSFFENSCCCPSYTAGGSVKAHLPWNPDQQCLIKLNTQSPCDMARVLAGAHAGEENLGSPTNLQQRSGQQCITVKAEKNSDLHPGSTKRTTSTQISDSCYSYCNKYVYAPFTYFQITAARKSRTHTESSVFLNSQLHLWFLTESLPCDSLHFPWQ